MKEKNNLIFIPPHPLNTAVLFLVFNRFDTTRQVFDAIREARPPRLYVAADGARQTKEGEAEKVKAVRDYIISNIDWECEVKTLFREQNFGCKMAVSGAIDWFFENEEMGIILEDDCLPSQSFFWFCEELLDRYKDDTRVGMISGDNFQNGIIRGEADYYFSIYNHIWGWASWANRWKFYDRELLSFQDTKFIDRVIYGFLNKVYWKFIFHRMKSKKIDTWDYQWTFTMWNNDWLTILPNTNLISNIGFGADATHTISESEFSNIKSSDIVVKFHPNDIQVNIQADQYTTQIMFNIVKRIKQKFLLVRI